MENALKLNRPGQSTVLLAVGLMAIIVMMVLPVPSVVLDIGLPVMDGISVLQRWRDALATPPPPSRLPLSRYATRTRSSPPRDRGCSLKSAILNFRHAPSTRGGGPATRPTHTTLLTLSPASSFDDNSADSPRNRPPAATTR